MGKTGCTLDGNLDNSKFSEPIPWIGAYAAAASAACAVAMAIDALHGLRYRKFWFPCKIFSINATTLTLLGVATKLSVDLNTSMPSQQDQLAKLSSSVFLCTVIANFLPSLGTMENKEILMNLMALGIYVITVIVNICIQLGTGVIYMFWREYVITMCLMVVLSALMVASALTIPATKRYLDMKYAKKHRSAKRRCNYQMDRCISHNVYSKLREDLTRYWMMAHTCNPQFVMGRLATCTASGAFCLVSTATLAEAMLRSYFMPGRFKFCSGQSDYKWSSTLILVTQTIAVVIGTLAPVSRWFIAINFTCPKKAKKAFKFELGVEDYWICTLNQWRDNPFFCRMYGRYSRKLAESIKKKALGSCIRVQIGVVWMSKLVRLVSVFCVVRLLIRSLNMVKLMVMSLRCNSSVRSQDVGSDLPANKMQELSRYVLHLDGEKELVDMMMERNCDPINHWIKLGQSKQPRHLIRLLEKLKPTQGFEGVTRFDSDLVSSLDSEEPPNSWALPVVTLTSIAIAIPNTEHTLVKQLIHSVHEALMYIRIIEEILDAKRDLTNIRKAAEIVWAGVDLHYKWQDLDLRKVATDRACPKEVLRVLSHTAKQRFIESRKKDSSLFCLRDSPAKWPIDVLAANSMYRISETLLLFSNTFDCQTGERMFQRVSEMITDIVGACLTNLQHVISEQCHQSNIEQREDKVRNAVLLLGKTQKILGILEQQAVLSTDPEQRWFIGTWRIFSKQKTLQLCNSSSTTCETAASSSPDVHLTVD